MSSDTPATESPLAIVASGLSKYFPGVVALDSVSLGFASGKVTAVVGENGAGKSTLMSILAGLQRPDSGDVAIHGEVVRTFTPHHLLDHHRVALVPQEIALCRERTVAENVLLGREPGVVPSRRRMVGEARSLLSRIDDSIDPLRRAGALSVAEQQLVLIVRALARRCEILILDEPTTSLTQTEVDRLFRLLHQLKDSGTTIIYVSHRLPEIFELSDSIHVLRDGSLVDSFETSQVDPARLVRAMVGRTLTERIEDPARTIGNPLLRVAGLSGRAFQDVTLTVAEREIVGVAGLPDSGRSELVSALFGAIRSTGSIELAGVPLSLDSPREAIRAGIAYVPAERRSQGIFPAMNIAANLTLLDLEASTRLGIVRRASLGRLAAERLEQFDVRGRPDGKITQLSGGNQQKVILARWLARQPRLLLLDDPTRGVDVGAKSEIHARLRIAAEAGAAIVMSSSELPELIRTCDRIIVMHGGRIAGELDGATATEAGVMALATGLTKAAA